MRIKRMLLALLFAGGVFTANFAQELSVSAFAKTYAPGEQIWANLSVLNATTVPGAYNIKVTYDANKLRFLNILPASSGPFSITPAASSSGGIVTVAGFQGIVDTGRGNASLVTLVFTPASGSLLVDTASFVISGKEVYNAQAQSMDLKVTKQTTSVLLPAPAHAGQQRIVFTKNYIRFSILKEGIASVRIFDLSGRTCADPLRPTLCRAGYHAVPVGTSLRSGTYLVAVRSAGLSTVEKLEVVR